MMTEREKVIKGLGKLHENCGCVAVHDCDCKTCPYERVNGCCDQIVVDALALLKAQDARVMTLEEVKAFEWDYCYLEEERLPGKEYRAVVGDYAITCITWPCITSMRIQHGDNNYNRTWRCWTSRPTDEQREATPWGG